MAVTTFCQACCRVLRVPDSTVGRRIQCPCGSSFRVEKPLPLRIEEERQKEYWRRGLAFLGRLERRGIGRPVFRKRILSASSACVILCLCVAVYLEKTLFQPPPPPPRPIPVRMMFAEVDKEVAESGTSTKDPIRPVLPVGTGRPADEPGLDRHPVPQDYTAASTPDSPGDRDGSPDRGRWRMVPEEANKLWELEGVDEIPKEGRPEPDEVTGTGSPVEGAPARPSDDREPEEDAAKGRRGTNPERDALERLARESTGGGIRFFGSPLPLEGDGIIFVIDRSASMILRVAPPADAPVKRASWSKLDLAKWELKKAIAILPEDKKFNVVFFDDCLERWRYQLHPAKPRNKRDVYDWLDTCEAQGQSNLSEAVVAALEEPGTNTIVLLSDGMPNVLDCRSMTEGPPWVHRERIRQSNVDGEKIWCFSFSEDVDSAEFLQKLAEESGGHYTEVSAKPF